MADADEPRLVFDCLRVHLIIFVYAQTMTLTVTKPTEAKWPN